MAPGRPRNPDSDPVSTTCPASRATICGSTAPMTRTAPVKLISAMAVASLAFHSVAGIGQ